MSHHKVPLVHQQRDKLELAPMRHVRQHLVSRNLLGLNLSVFAHSLENLHTRYEVSNKSVKKLKGAFRARLKKLSALNTAIKAEKVERPPLEQLRQ